MGVITGLGSSTSGVSASVSAIRVIWVIRVIRVIRVIIRVISVIKVIRVIRAIRVITKRFSNALQIDLWLLSPRNRGQSVTKSESLPLRFARLESAVSTGICRFLFTTSSFNHDCKNLRTANLST